jgi:hypothetical protein
VDREKVPTPPRKKFLTFTAKPNTLHRYIPNTSPTIILAGDDDGDRRLPIGRFLVENGETAKDQ